MDGRKLIHSYAGLDCIASQVLAIADAMIRTIGRAAGEPEFAKTSAAMDATGFHRLGPHYRSFTR